MDPPPPLATQEGWVAVAVGKEDYHQSLACGMCLEIHNKEKGNINGIVYDLCETCGRGTCRSFNAKYFPTKVILEQMQSRKNTNS